MSIMEPDQSVEQKILEAAGRVFYRKGKDGTSMQDIAKEAGITRTSLNYYYRTKDKLFDVVFRNTMEHFVPRIAEVLNDQQSVSEYIDELVTVIIDSMIERPQIPVFVLQELTSNPQRVPVLMAELGIHPAEAVGKFRNDRVLSGLMVDPRQVVINILSLCIFPFAGKPLLVSVMFDGDESAYIEAMNERKKIIPLMIDIMIKNMKP